MSCSAWPLFGDVPIVSLWLSSTHTVYELHGLELCKQEKSCHIWTFPHGCTLLKKWHMFVFFESIYSCISLLLLNNCNLLLSRKKFHDALKCENLTDFCAIHVMFTTTLVYVFLFAWAQALFACLCNMLINQGHGVLRLLTAAKRTAMMLEPSAVWKCLKIMHYEAQWRSRV